MLSILLAALETEEEREYFAHFYEEHNTDLFRFALYRMDQHQQKAEDALQEMWERSMKNPKRFFTIPDDKRIAWMVTILKRSCVNVINQEIRHGTPPDEVLIELDWSITEAAFDHYDDIVAMIRAMSETYRTVLELKFVEGWSNQEIAAYMGLSQEATDTRISRGRAKLKEQLIKEGYIETTDR